MTGWGRRRLLALGRSATRDRQLMLAVAGEGRDG